MVSARSQRIRGKAKAAARRRFQRILVKGIWQCFGCGAKGNLIEFAGRMEGMNPDDPQDFQDRQNYDRVE